MSNPQHSISADKLTLSYEDKVAVRESTFALPWGGVTAIIGPNGSGKSTLLHAIAGTLPLRSGSLELGDGVRNRVSYVMQTVNVAPGTPITVREVVGMGRYAELGWWRPFRKSDRNRVDAAMERLGITDLAGRHLSELSGGQRQRVYVAQGIVQDHDLLLLDEPLTGLDLVSARVIDELIHSESSEGCSVLVTTHDLEEARAADQVVLMAGRVLAYGPPEEVLTRHNLETAYGLGSLHESSETFMDDPAHSDEGSDPTPDPGR